MGHYSKFVADVQKRSIYQNVPFTTVKYLWQIIMCRHYKKLKMVRFRPALCNKLLEAALPWLQHAGAVGDSKHDDTSAIMLREVRKTRAACVKQTHHAGHWTTVTDDWYCTAHTR